MRLTYSYDLDTVNKQRIFNRILAENRIQEAGGRLYIEAELDGLYPAILQFARTLAKVTSPLFSHSPQRGAARNRQIQCARRSEPAGPLTDRGLGPSATQKMPVSRKSRSRRSGRNAGCAPELFVAAYTLTSSMPAFFPRFREYFLSVGLFQCS